MKIITLLTDFGLQDGYVGVMKGVIWGICPDAHIADITHTIAPQNIRQGALALALTCPYYPPGSVHVAVVDPGVGTARRPVAMRVGAHFFVGPDNGLFSPVLDDAKRSGKSVIVVQLDQPEYWLKDISHVFHGRDIFSPVAAHLACGVPIDKVGTPIFDPVRFSLPEAVISPEGIQGQVMLLDNYGNMYTNIPLAALSQYDPTSLKIKVAGQLIQGLLPSFGFGVPGQLVAVHGTYGTLTVAQVNGNAAALLSAGVDTPVEVSFA
ncbi:MAG: SAM-dependent chlorinase/fluorinase [Anaerolineaceae bacterium]|nr:SAM-dependent chlorinase/fluorinase [Anaerolineaceae bacterium]